MLDGLGLYLGEGFERFDGHHERLVDAADEIVRMSDALKSDGVDAILPAVRRLRSMAEYHFSEEEDMMVRLEFSGTDNHAEEHAALLRRLDDLVDSLETGDVSALELGDVAEWLIHHIREVDIEYADYVEEGGASLQA